MTKNPKVVSTTDSAIEALTIMVEHHFRHLPVVNGEGSVVGLLDIGKCLNDAISRLERAAEEKGGNAAVEAVKKVAALQSPGNPNAAAALESLLGNLMSQAAGGQAIPTLRKLLHSKPKTVVRPSSTVRETAKLMAESRRAALVVDEMGHLVGIFGFKDMMTRVVACELPLDETEVSEVMTPHPEFVSPDISVLEALHVMYDNKVRLFTYSICVHDFTFPFVKFSKLTLSFLVLLPPVFDTSCMQRGSDCCRYCERY
jgi:CBS domain-containing protein